MPKKSSRIVHKGVAPSVEVRKRVLRMAETHKEVGSLLDEIKTDIENEDDNMVRIHMNSLEGAMAIMQHDYSIAEDMLYQARQKFTPPPDGRRRK